MSTTTSQKELRSVLVIGLVPSSAPGSPWPPEKLNPALEEQQTLAKSRNWNLTMHTVDPSQSVQDIMSGATEALRSREHWDVVGIGFGVRGNLGLTEWFERLVNLVVKEAVLKKDEGKQVTRLGFLTSPDRLVQDTEAFVEREQSEGR